MNSMSLYHRYTSLKLDQINEREQDQARTLIANICNEFENTFNHNIISTDIFIKMRCIHEKNKDDLFYIDAFDVLRTFNDKLLILYNYANESLTQQDAFDRCKTLLKQNGLYIDAYITLTNEILFIFDIIPTIEN